MNPRLNKGSRLVVATHNPGKAREIAALLGGDFEVLTASEAGVPEPEETESTFVGNAVLKARHAAAASGEVSLADDSGLSVRGLDGQPGSELVTRGYLHEANAVIAALTKVLPGQGKLTDEVRVKLRQAVQDGTVDGVTGKVAFDRFGDRTTRVLTVYQVEKDASGTLAWKPKETKEFQ